MTLDPIQILSRLVAIPSVNPMGRPVAESDPLESRLTECLEGLFDQIGLAHQRQRVEPRRDNLIGRLDGDVPPERGGGLVLFEAHQDTVPVDGMTIEPFSPAIRDGRLYGRGSCDVKGGMAAMLAALARLARRRPPGMPTIVMACTVNEEHGFTGPGPWRSCGSRPPAGSCRAGPTRPWWPSRPAWTSWWPTRATIRWRCHARGRAAHSARPEQGENAIYKMGLRAGAHRALRPRGGGRPGPAPALRSPHAERGHDPRGAQRQHGARPLHDRDRPPSGARRSPRAGLAARRGLDGRRRGSRRPAGARAAVHRGAGAGGRGRTARWPRASRPSPKRWPVAAAWSASRSAPTRPSSPRPASRR